MPSPEHPALLDEQLHHADPQCPCDDCVAWWGEWRQPVGTAPVQLDPPPCGHSPWWWNQRAQACDGCRQGVPPGQRRW